MGGHRSGVIAEEPDKAPTQQISGAGMMSAQITAIVGSTAVGKSGAAVELARNIDGEIINADSRQVYRGMNIGAAKPTQAEMGGVPHHLFDVAEPDEVFSLGLFLERARCAISDALARGRRPIIVGGTGQYVWALLEGWNVPQVPPNDVLRQELAERAEIVGRQAIHAELRSRDPVAAENIHPNNLNRAIRALEVIEMTGRPFSDQRTRTAPPWDSQIAGIAIERTALNERIENRIDAQLRGGWLEEVKALLERGFTADLSSFRSIGYREVSAHAEGRLSWDDMRLAIIKKTRRLARTQSAWFRKDDPRIVWRDATELLVNGRGDAPERIAQQIQERLGLTRQT